MTLAETLEPSRTVLSIPGCRNFGKECADITPHNSGFVSGGGVVGGPIAVVMGSLGSGVGGGGTLSLALGAGYPHLVPACSSQVCETG